MPFPRFGSLDFSRLIIVILVGRLTIVAPQCSSDQDFSISYPETTGPSFIVSHSNGSCLCPGGFVGKVTGDGSALANLAAQPEVAAALADISRLQSDVSLLRATVVLVNGTVVPAISAAVNNVVGTVVPGIQSDVNDLRNTVVPALDLRLGDLTASVVPKIQANISALNAGLAQLRDTTVPAIAADVAQLKTVTVPGIQADLSDLRNTVVAAIGVQLDLLTTSVVPKIQANISALNAGLAQLRDTTVPAIAADVAQLKTVTVPGIQADLSDLRNTVVAAIGVQLDLLTTSVVPKIQGNMSALNAGLAQLRDTTVPAIAADVAQLKTVTVPAIQTDVALLKNTTVPALQAQVNNLQNVVVPTIQNDLSSLKDVVLSYMLPTLQLLNASMSPYGNGRFRACRVQADCNVSTICVRGACLRTPTQNGIQTYLEAGVPNSYVGGGGWLDLSGKGRHFITSLTTLWTPNTDVAYKGVYFGPFASSPGSLVPSANSASLGFTNNAFTAQIFFNLDSASPFSLFGMSGSGSSCGANQCLHVRSTGTSATCRFGFYTNDLDMTIDLQPNVDYHLTFKYNPSLNGGTQSIYMNGYIVGAGPLTTPVTSTKGINLAGVYDSGTLQGWVYNFAVWNRALTDAEVLNNYLGYADWGFPLTPTSFPRQYVTSGLKCSLDASLSSSYSGSGTQWTDLSGNNNHGTIATSIVSYSSPYFTLPGTDGQAIVLQKPSLLGVYQSSFTMMLLFRPTTLVNGANRNLIGTRVYTSCGTSICMHFQTQGNRLLYMNFYGNDCGPSNFAMDPGYDYLVHFVYDLSAKTSTIYLNTKVQISCTGITQYNSDNPLQIGQLSASPGSYMFIGRIYSFRSYNRALSANEVAQNFQAACDSGKYLLA
eukprot:TRINITY_DN3008_c0_g1_i1.p1 TRINITY_DN3008_c0_g1~~TRINITY_DN3008_c0_g1_i1.p1  ORF type:complete len:881 (-),score=248.28 TRINITY_DN3008_c0_g1_i1:333-2975(-)